MTKRPGTMSDDERALEHRRHRAPALGVPVDTYDDVTGQYEGEDLERMRFERARRFPAASIVALEKKHDALEKEVRDGFAKMAEGQSATREGLAETRAGVSTLLDLAARAEAERERRAARDAAEQEKKREADGKALEGRRRHTIALVSAFGVAIAGIIAAVVR